MKLVWVSASEQFCSGGDCFEVAAIGGDWFRVRSSVNKHMTVAFTGAEMRAFVDAVKAGEFDALVARSI